MPIVQYKMLLFTAFAGAGAGLPVRGCNGLSKCGVCLNAGLSKYSLVNAGGSLRARSNSSLNSNSS